MILSKKNGETKEEFIEKFRNMEINLNGQDVSDIIIKHRFDNTYTNQSNGLTSNNVYDVITPKKRYIIVGNNVNMPEDLYGVYLKYDKKRDILIAVSACLVRTPDKAYWKERKRSFISRDCYEDSILDLFFEKSMDICGQTIINGSYSYGQQQMVPVGLKAELYKYFKDSYPIIGYYDYRLQFSRHSTFDDMFDVFNTLTSLQVATKHDYVFIHSGGYPVFYAEGEYSEKYYIGDSAPIPRAAKLRMIKIARREIKDNFFAASFGTTRGKSDAKLSFLQKKEDELVLRVFEPMYLYNENEKDTDIKFVEIYNVVINSDEPARYNTMLRDSVLLWCDDLSGTVIEHAAWLINDCINKTVKVFAEAEDEASYYSLTKTLDSLFKKKYSFCGERCIIGAVAICNPVLEKVMAVLRQINGFEKSKLFYSIMDIIKYSLAENDSLQSVVVNCFGQIDETKKKFHLMLGLPKGMFGEIVRCDMSCQSIVTIKEMFKKDKEFLLRMNSEDWMELLFFIKYFEENNKIAQKGCLRLLMERFNVKNWENYVGHIMRMDSNEIQIYYDYLQFINKIGEAAKDAQWKLNGDSLIKARDSAEEVSLCMNINNYDKMCEKYKKLGEKWKKYEFSDCDYSLSFPKKPDDIIADSIKLKHCGKEFVEKVGEEETEILFVRKQSEPEKPFFTVEVRNGRIRQCHGACNGNADAKVRKFLYSWCIKTGVEFNNRMDDIVGL